MGCSFKLAQLELTRGPSAIGAPAAASFAPELAKRASRRRALAQAERRAAAEEERSLRARTGGKSTLAVEMLQGGWASPTASEPPSIAPTSDWHESWQRREEAATGPSFRLMVEKGYAAAGAPPSPFNSPPAGPTHPAASPSAHSAHSSPRTSAGGYYARPSPPAAGAIGAAPALAGFVLGDGGGLTSRASASAPASSMLHCGGGTRWCVPARGQAAPPAADDDEAPPPDLAASWAAAPVAAAKGRKGRGVVLLSNGGGRRP